MHILLFVITCGAMLFGIGISMILRSKEKPLKQQLDTFRTRSFAEIDKSLESIWREHNRLREGVHKNNMLSDEFKVSLKSILKEMAAQREQIAVIANHINSQSDVFQSTHRERQEMSERFQKELEDISAKTAQRFENAEKNMEAVLDTYITEVESRLKTLSADNKKFKEDLKANSLLADNFKSVMQSVSNEGQQLKAIVNQLSKELNSEKELLRTTLDDKQNNQYTLRKDLEDMKQKIEANARTADVKRKSQSALEDSISAVKNKLQEALSKNKKLEDEIRLDSTASHGINKRLAEVVKENARLRMLVEGFAHEVARENQNFRKQVAKFLNEITSRKEAIQLMLAGRNEEFESFRKELESAKASVLSNKELLNSNKHNADIFKARLETLNKENAASRDAIEQFLKQVKSYKDNADASLEAERTKLETIQNTIDDIKSNNGLALKIDKIEKRLKNTLSTHKAEIESKIQSLLSDDKKIDEVVKSSRLMTNDFKRELAAVRSEIENINSKLKNDTDWGLDMIEEAELRLSEIKEDLSRQERTAKNIESTIEKTGQDIEIFDKDGNIVE